MDNQSPGLIGSQDSDIIIVDPPATGPSMSGAKHDLSPVNRTETAVAASTSKDGQSPSSSSK